MSYEDISSMLAAARGEINEQVRTRVAAVNAMDAVLKALKDPTKNAVALSESVTTLKKAAQGVLAPEVYQEAVTRLEKAANEELGNATFTFGRDLRTAFEAQGIALTGAAPRFVADPLVIEVDKKHGHVYLKYGRELLTQKPVKLDPARVVTEYSKTVKSLTGRKINPTELLAQFFDAYQRVLFVAGRDLGERANIVECYTELVWLKQPISFRRTPSKAAFSDYPRAYFAYDMFQLRQENNLKHKEYRLQLGTATIDATGNDTRVIWLPEGADDGRYMMDVFWVKEDR